MVEVVTKALRSARFELRLDRPLLVGVVNVTPDSFSDGGRFVDGKRASALVDRLVADGADLIDIGGESTRPGSEPVTADMEIRRVIPVVRHAAANHDLPVSVDTSKAEVAEAVLDAGASVINDVMGIELDRELASVAAKYSAGLIIMHIRGVPRTMQLEPVYDDLMGEIRDELAESVRVARECGLEPDRIAIDPGIGFGKRPEQNLEILRRLGELRELGCPIMVGTSRKSFIGKVLDAGVDDRLMGTIGSVVAGYHYGASLFRVHDIRPCLEALRVAHAIATGNTDWSKAAAASV